MNNGRIKVLLIDDDDDFLVITRRMLAEVSGTVIELKGVATFELGLEAVRSRAFDAYLIDYSLGARNGIELIQMAIAEGCRAPLILLTGMGQHEIDKQAMQAGAADFLAKDRIDGVDIERSVIHAIERAHAAEEHLKQDAELRMLSQQLPVILWTTDEQLQFTSGYGAGLQKLGLVPNQLVGLSLLDYFKTPDGVQELIEPHQRALQGETVSYQSQWMNRQYRIQVSPLWHNGLVPGSQKQLIGTVGIALDITDAQQIEDEVSAAQKVQVGLLPKESPHIPGYDIAGICRPTAATGGDYFDFIEMPDGSWGLMVADVSGHGFASALITMEVRRLIRTLVRWGADLDNILSAANQAACEHPDADRKFVTLFFACLDPQARSFTYGAAGHQGFVLDAAGHVTHLLAVSLPLGMKEVEKYPRNGPVLLEPGDVFLLFTDGIDETFDPTGKIKFGIPRVLELVQTHRHLPAAGIVDVVIQEVLQYCHPNLPHDDLTMMVLKVT
jgi:PAS domain S-box-containing protein